MRLGRSRLPKTKMEIIDFIAVIVIDIVVLTIAIYFSRRV